jgi:catechol 2,3-dioxygenase-like lactoylglutathione lyase family enzyme
VITIAGIDHIVLRTSRLQAMLEFYCGALGCVLERETRPELGLVQLRAGDALIDLVTVDGELGRQGGGPPGDTENNMDHFCLQLEPVGEQAICEHLKAHAIAVGEFAERYGAQGFGRSLYISDPEGNTVELRERMAQGPA